MSKLTQGDIFQEPLFIFEMANNHMGSLAHGLQMVRTFAAIAKNFPYQFAIKLQFRDLDTFIHPSFQGRTDLKYVKRFSETKLSVHEFQELKNAITGHGFISICTPFDERSISLIDEMDFDAIKIASCSFTDWPLLERVSKSTLPIIASTAAASLTEIDRVVSFFRNRNRPLALMHCVGEYPTKAESLQLNQIDILKQRYPGISVGFSTHEDPQLIDSIPIAIAKGAKIFEKHIALETPEFQKNAYSATPEQVRAWLDSAHKAFQICGISGRRYQSSESEIADLRQFKRGVYARVAVKKGERIDTNNLFLAFPNTADQLVANDLSKYHEFYAEQDIAPGEAVSNKAVKKIDERQKVYEIVNRARQFLSEGNIVIPGMASLEVSHHYGLDRFEQFGCTLITIVNREYCKKLIVMFPGQTHPEQFHDLKEESFLVLHGSVVITLNGAATTYRRGDFVTVHRGVKHILRSENGAIIEEISSTHYPDDSHYTDESISKNPNRKSILNCWLDTEE